MGRSATFRFHGDLADLRRSRPVEIESPLAEATTVMDSVEALGVPHVEVGTVRVDGRVAEPGRRLHGGEVVDVHPRDDPLAGGPARFALDGHLGTLARRLRLLGIDTWYRTEVDDAELADLAATEDRVLLTRDVGLLKRGVLTRGAWIRATDPDEQVLEVVDRFGLGPHLAPYSRCLRCNGTIREATAAEAAAAPPGARREHARFRVCVACGRLYWRGGHTGGLDAVVDRVRRHAGG